MVFAKSTCIFVVTWKFWHIDEMLLMQDGVNLNAYVTPLLLGLRTVNIIWYAIKVVERKYILCTTAHPYARFEFSNCGVYVTNVELILFFARVSEK